VDEIGTLLALRRFGGEDDDEGDDDDDDDGDGKKKKKTQKQKQKQKPKLDLRKLCKEEGDMVMGSLSKTQTLPVFFLNHDVTYEGGLHADFPPLPAPVRWVLREGFPRWKAEWWKFSTCGYDGRPRELAFLGKAA
jgi:hypothetical protein